MHCCCAIGSEQAMAGGVSIRRDGDGDGDVTPTSSPLGCDLGPSWRTRAPAQIRVAVPSRPHALQGQGPQPKVTADTHMVISSIASPSERAPLLTSLSVDRSCLGLATIEHGAADRSDSKQQRRARTYRAVPRAMPPTIPCQASSGRPGGLKAVRS